MNLLFIKFSKILKNIVLYQYQYLCILLTLLYYIQKVEKNIKEKVLSMMILLFNKIFPFIFINYMHLFFFEKKVLTIENNDIDMKNKYFLFVFKL